VREHPLGIRLRVEVQILRVAGIPVGDAEARPALERERLAPGMTEEDMLHVVPLDGMQGDTPGPGLGGELRPGERLNPPRGC